MSQRSAAAGRRTSGHRSRRPGRLHQQAVPRMPWRRRRSAPARWAEREHVGNNRDCSSAAGSILRSAAWVSALAKTPASAASICWNTGTDAVCMERDMRDSRWGRFTTYIISRGFPITGAVIDHPFFLFFPDNDRSARPAPHLIMQRTPHNTRTFVLRARADRLL